MQFCRWSQKNVVSSECVTVVVSLFQVRSVTSYFGIFGFVTLELEIFVQYIYNSTFTNRRVITEKIRCSVGKDELTENT